MIGVFYARASNISGNRFYDFDFMWSVDDAR